MPRNDHSHPVLELTVNNHPGVMSHITGLFSRRIFNLEGILCGAIGDGSRSRMLLQVYDDERLPRVIKELENLHDVFEVRLRRDVDPSVFDPLQAISGRAEHASPPARAAERRVPDGETVQ